MVTDTPRRITAYHRNGISSLERDLWSQGIDYMARKGPLAFISIVGETEPVVRTRSRAVKSYIALRQDRAGMRGPYWSEVRETKARDKAPKPSAHIVAPMPSAAARDKLVQGVNLSTTYGDALAMPVTDIEVVKRYCLKEMTSQAAYKTGVRRIKGSHPLPEGGDRVRASGAVITALIRSGQMQNFQRSYARSAPKAIVKPSWTFDEMGQGLLFTSLPERERPLNIARTGSRRLKMPELPMLRRFLAVSNTDVLEVVKKLGDTDKERAAKLGLSRPQVTNALNLRFGLSKAVVRRVLELARSAS